MPVLSAAEAFMLGETPAATSMAMIAHAGFEQVEIIVPHRIGVTPSDDEVAELRRHLETNNLAVSALSGGWPLASADPDVRSQAVRDLSDLIRLAGRLGTAQVTSEINGGTTLREAESRAAAQRSLEELVPVLEAEEVRLAVEPHPGDVIERQAEGLALIREIGSPTIGYLYCCPHTFVLGDDAATLIRDASDLLMFVHVADSNRQDKIVVGYRVKGYANALTTEEFKDSLTAHEHLLLGRGDLDFQEIARALQDVGYTGVLSAVPFGLTTQADVDGTFAAMHVLRGSPIGTQ